VKNAGPLGETGTIQQPTQIILNTQSSPIIQTTNHKRAAHFGQY